MVWGGVRYRDGLETLAKDARPSAAVQCDISAGRVMLDNRVRATPPGILSAQRGWPQALIECAGVRHDERRRDAVLNQFFEMGTRAPLPTMLDLAAP